MTCSCMCNMGQRMGVACVNAWACNTYQQVHTHPWRVTVQLLCERVALGTERRKACLPVANRREDGVKRKAADEWWVHGQQAVAALLQGDGRANGLLGLWLR